jgi:methanogenic corrinoid protein MtbC1
MRRSIEDGILLRDWRPSPPGPADGDTEWLQRTIETEIVPRLMLAHRAPVPVVVATPERLVERTHTIGLEDVAAFTVLVLRDDVDACASFVGALLERGVALDEVHLGLFAPSARRLGRLWEEDRCDFAQVTLGLWRLQNLVFDLSPQLPDDWPHEPTSQRRVLLAAAPGSQHTLGLLMVAEFFRRSGWTVWSDPCASEGDLAALLRSEWFDVLGLSVGMDAHVRTLGSVILGLRRASRNPEIGVMVGGPIVSGTPGMVAQVGADFTAADARQAVEYAESFVSARTLSS